MTFTHALGTNNYGPAKFIVDASAANGTHTTIASALTSATSGDTIFIRPGTYTENLTLKAGVNLAAYSCDSYTPNVIILGKATATFAGTCTISGIQLKTNSDFCLSVTGSAATLINLKGCFIDCNNNNAIQFTSSSPSSKIQIYDCKGDIDTTGIAYFTHSGAGAIKFFGGVFENDGAATTASTCSGSGGLNFYNIFFSNAITTSSTSGFSAANCQFVGYPLILNGTGTNQISNCFISSGSSSAISVGTGAALNLSTTSIDSSNTNAITGAGTLNYGPITFTNSSSTVNTTTRASLPLGFAPAGGSGSISSNVINTYETGTFTPGVAFGGGTSSLTYTTQQGQYVKVGTLVFVSGTITLSNKGISTGTATLTGLPFTASNSTTTQEITVSLRAAITLTSTSFTWVTIAIVTGGTVGNIDECGSNQARTQLSDTAFANTSSFAFSGIYTAS